MDDLTTVKRLNYFDHQFLRANDFNDEQGYHLGMRRLHNQLLHSWGIADGLDVSFQGGATSVTVASGVAMDDLGREIVVPADQTVELASFPANAAMYLTISYDEKQTDETAETGAAGKTRWTEQWTFAALQNAPGNPGRQIVLAIVRRTGTEVTGLDVTGRRAAGAAGGSLEVLGLGFRDPSIASSGWVRMRLEAANRALVQGGLHISGALAVDGNATVNGTLTSVGAFAATHGLSVSGGAAVSGDVAVSGNLTLTGTGNVTLRRALVVMGTTDGSQATRGAVVGALGFFGYGVQHGQLAFRPGNGFELVDVSGSAPQLAYAADSLPYADLRVRNVVWSTGATLLDDQGGSLELGGNANVAGTGTPYIDFHFRAKKEDFNVRLINDVDGQLTTQGKAVVTSDFGVRGRLYTGNLPTTVARNPTFTTGEVHVTGAGGGGWSFGNRETAEDQVWANVAGNRWVLYSSGSIARLWTAQYGDRLTIDGLGNTVVAGMIGANGYPASPHNPGWHGIRCWDLEAEGSIWTAHGITALGGKGGYVVDQFINNAGEALEEGDVVVIASAQAGASYGLRGNIPIPEVDPATEAYDRRVCGIVSQVRGEMGLPEDAPKRRSRKAPPLNELELKRFSDPDIDELGHAKVKPGQVGEMVTLGAFSHCKVDARFGPIEVGDLLTTSPTKGHAQKALEPERAIGAIIGKALAAVPKGRAKIPVIVLLQ